MLEITFVAQSEGILTSETVRAWQQEENDHLNTKLKNSSSFEPEPTYFHPSSNWAHMNLPSTDCITLWDTGCNLDLLRYVAKKSVEVPNDFVSFS